VTSVHGDRYAGEWPREQFRKHGVNYTPSEQVKSDLYRDLLPLLTSGRAELLDDPRLVRELLGLERKTARGGKDSIDHAPGAHDDTANAVAGALVLATAAPTVGALLLDDEPHTPFTVQVKEQLQIPRLFDTPDPDLCCGTCTWMENGRCTNEDGPWANHKVEATSPMCSRYDPLPEGED
jgi:hypothetical protein